MIGGSYGGQIQFATAAVDPRVDTLVPLITWNDLRYSLAPNNTSFTRGVTYAGSTPGTEKIGWSGLFFGVGIARRDPGAAIDPARNVGCPNFVLEACQAKATLDTLGLPHQSTTALTDRVSVGHYIDKVKVPTFLIQGENDTLFNLQEATATYRSLKARGVPVTMAWQSWGHSGGTGANTGAAPGELDLTGQHIEDTYLGLRIKNWFDHYLKRSAVSTGPEFSYFRDWVGYTGSAAPAYASAGSYPVGPAALYLSVRRRAGVREVVDPAGLELLVQPGTRARPPRTPRSPVSRVRSTCPDGVTRRSTPPARSAPGPHPRSRSRSPSSGPRPWTCGSSPRSWRPPSRPARAGSCRCSPSSTTSRPTARRRWCTS